MSSGALPSVGRASDWAAEAYALVQVHPRDALALAERAQAAAVAEADPAAEVAALHALAWAQHVLGDPRAAATARTGVRIAEQHGNRHGVGLLRRRLALTLALAGEMRAAQREIEAAIECLSGRERARSEVHRVEIHRRAQVVDPAARRRLTAGAARALRTLRRSGDELWEARLLYNRGLLFEDRGDLDEAEADLRRAYLLLQRVGADAAVVNAKVALGTVALLRGDVVACLRTLDEVEATDRPEQPYYGLSGWRAKALVEARLLPEAREAAETYVDLCVRTGRDDYVGGALLDLAAIALLSGDPASAHRHATSAARSFSARGKTVNAALARTSVLRARLADGSVRRSSVRSGLHAAAVLEQAAWRVDALRARLVTARVALAVGSRTTAGRQLELARPLHSRGTVLDRIELCHAQALLHLADGDDVAAERSLAKGLLLLEDYRAALGAGELRATASSIGSDLAQLGLELAIGSRKPAKILAWAERLRGNALRLPPVRPTADRELGRLQAELRRVAAQIREAEERGKAAPGLPARRRALETAIRSRTRTLRGGGDAPSNIPDLREAKRLLGDRALVEYVELDSRLYALTLVDGRLNFHELGPNTVANELEWLRFALARLAQGRLDAAQRDTARGNAEAAARALDALLVEPLLPVLGEAALVVVPTGVLHVLPWGALPSLRGRPVVVPPSLSVWLDVAQRPPSRRRKTALIAGPRLRHAVTEVRDVAELRPNATVLAGAAATAKAALAALDGAALAHLACHGRFRADSPLFSSLELADGPLDVYELQRLRRAPEIVVLSACDLGVSSLHPGDELLGLSAALLGMGTRTIVASVVPVPDAAARRLMLSFHRNLASGLRPASALAAAKAGSAGFVCLGSG